MEITIDYESSWRNSFLDGNNNEPLPKEGRDYIGSSTTLKKDPKNFIRREITLDTVMGILNRLIGDQRRLYQSRLDQNYFFASIEPLIGFVDVDEKQTKSQEVIYLRNMKGSFDQNSFSGMIRVNDPLLNSDYASELWRVLALDLPEVLEFIVTEKIPAESQSASLDPLWIVQRFAEIDKLKLAGIDFKSAFDKLQTLFPEYQKLSMDDVKKASLFYCGALYAVVESLKSRFDLSTGLTKNNLLPGISKKGLTEKDFMKRFTTGSGKRIYGNPYILKEKIKGEGERISMLTKASGQLTITLDIPREQGIRLKEMIECAGVSSFYLGKKGLAFVSSIRA
jgi:hypothetical protein